MAEDYAKTIGDNIRKHRHLRKMTREQLAEALELDTAYLGQCERGERQLGLSKTLQLISFFGVTPNDILPTPAAKNQRQGEEYREKINLLMEDCSDRQLLAIYHTVSSVLPFLVK